MGGIPRPEKCEAYTKSGEKCHRRATHYHETPGDAVHLCTQHYQSIKRRMRLGSDEELVRAWRSHS